MERALHGDGTPLWACCCFQRRQTCERHSGWEMEIRPICGRHRPLGWGVGLNTRGESSRLCPWTSSAWPRTQTYSKLQGAASSHISGFLRSPASIFLDWASQGSLALLSGIQMATVYTPASNVYPLGSYFRIPPGSSPKPRRCVAALREAACSSWSSWEHANISLLRTQPSSQASAFHLDHRKWADQEP